MKKFYYTKDASVDKTPIILSLERRHTMAVDKNRKDEENRIASRTQSVSSVNRIKEDSAITNLKTREITKSLSEDVLSKGHAKKSAKIITESDLSSSWLYKARKASMNSKDSPQKAPKTGLSPVALTDPKLKPIPVKSRSRSKKSESCLCYLAIMISISFCTIGVLAAITGILYNEMFSSKNLTSSELLNSLSDISNLVPEPRSLNDTNSTTGKLDFNKDTTHTFREGTNSTLILSGNSTPSLYEDQAEKIIHAVVSQKSVKVANLDELLDSRQVEVKFRDGDTIIYELNSNSSADYTNDPEVEELDSDENITGNINEVLISEDRAWSDEVSEEVKEPENLDILTNSQSRKLNNVLTNGEHEQIVHNMTLNVDELRVNYVNSSSTVTFENGSITLQTENKSEIFNSEPPLSFVYKPLSDVYYNETGFVITEIKNEKETLSDDLNSLEINKLESITELHKTDHLPAFNNTVTKLLTDKSEHHVESMLRVINEDEEESSNIFSNRNGEVITTIENSDFKPRSPSSFGMKNGINSPIEMPQSLEKEMPVQNVQQMKPLDMKVSLAEAMKHLQVLDVNNKIPSSRMKSVKPKLQNTQQTKLNENNQNKQSITMENVKYLQRLRLLLQENMLRT